jgi:23S rRNA pseudouridine1911/1915/1917 synthase
MGQFERREVEKEYFAIVRGEPSADSGTIDLPIANARMSKVELKMAVLADGMPSRTDWKVLERHGKCAVLSCSPFTGRQHQIRVHLAAIGHPVVGDKLYGPDEELFEKDLGGLLTREDLRALGMDRHALHNHRVAFVSPATGQRVEVRSPLPADMAAYLAKIDD